jgi:DNA-binding MarR family transcriptional regulator
MVPVSTPLAQLLIDPSLAVAQVDVTACRLVGAGRQGLIGLPIAELLVPEDRAPVAALLATVLADGIPRMIAARWLHPDGSAHGTDTHVSRLGTGEEARLALAAWMPPCASSVAAHWQVATILLHGLRAGRQQFGGHIISSPPAEILLMLYLAEAEGRSVTASLVAAETGYAWPMVERWLQALIASGFLETEDTPALSPATPLRLTTAGDAGVQQVLSGVGSPLTICSG